MYVFALFTQSYKYKSIRVDKGKEKKKQIAGYQVNLFSYFSGEHFP